jgi:hypothetical protein
MSEIMGMGSRVKLKNGQAGVFLKKLPFDKAEVAVEPLPAGVMFPRPDLKLHTHDADSYYRHQRNVVRKQLGSNWSDVEKFDQEFEKIQNYIAGRSGIECERVFRQFKKRASGSYVFMGMKGLTASVARAIQDNGIVALRFLEKKTGLTDTPRRDDVLVDTHGNSGVRAKLKALYPGISASLDEFALLQACNAHKSGPGVDKSGFHSTSGKPDYAAQYSDGSAELFDQDYYNLGVAISVSENSLPVMIAYAIQSWNERHTKDKHIEMAFEKTPQVSEGQTVNLTKRDYESEILLGGASTAGDFGYLGLWRVRRKQTDTGNALLNAIQGFNRGKLKATVTVEKKPTLTGEKT